MRLLLLKHYASQNALLYNPSEHFGTTPIITTLPQAVQRIKVDQQAAYAYSQIIVELSGVGNACAFSTKCARINFEKTSMTIQRLFMSDRALVCHSCYVLL